MNSNHLWLKRFITYLMLVSKYMKYILSGHLLVVLLFLFGFISINYQTWIANLDKNFPIAFIMSMVIGTSLVFGSIRSYLIKSDIVFLLPLESSLGKYFFRSFIVSLIVQTFFSVVLAVSLYLPYKILTVNAISFEALIAMIFIIKGAMLLTKFFSLFSQSHLERLVQFGIFIVTIVSTVYQILAIGSIFSWLLLLIPVVWAFATSTYIKHYPLPWEELISCEQQAMNRFFRLANLFTDVLHLQNSTNERRWIKLPSRYLDSTKAFNYLLMRTFIRSSDYLGLVVRLLIIVGIVVYFTTSIYGLIVACAIGLYLTGVQLIPIGRHYDYQVWLDLYPIESVDINKYVMRLVQVILVIQLIIWTIIIAIKVDFVASVRVFGVVSLLFFPIFTIYMQKKHSRE